MSKPVFSVCQFSFDNTLKLFNFIAINGLYAIIFIIFELERKNNNFNLDLKSVWRVDDCGTHEKA